MSTPSVPAETALVAKTYLEITSLYARLREAHDAKCGEAESLRAENERLQREADALYDSAAVVDLLEERGVVSIYFRDGSQFNPGSQSLLKAVLSTHPLDPLRSQLAATREGEARLPGLIEQARDLGVAGAICKSHGQSVLVCHLDGEPCSDFLLAGK